MDIIYRVKIYLSNRRTGKVIDVTRYIACMCCLEEMIDNTVMSEYHDTHKLTDILLYEERLFSCSSFEPGGSPFTLIKGGLDES